MEERRPIAMAVLGILPVAFALGFVALLAYGHREAKAGRVRRGRDYYHGIKR